MKLFSFFKKPEKGEVPPEISVKAPVTEEQLGAEMAKIIMDEFPLSRTRKALTLDTPFHAIPNLDEMDMGFVVVKLAMHLDVDGEDIFDQEGALFNHTPKTLIEVFLQRWRGKQA